MRCDGLWTRFSLATLCKVEAYEMRKLREAYELREVLTLKRGL
jgi:hypothetical protein